jgi:hypothetical protein
MFDGYGTLISAGKNPAVYNTRFIKGRRKEEVLAEKNMKEFEILQDK